MAEVVGIEEGAVTHWELWEEWTKTSEGGAEPGPEDG